MKCRTVHTNLIDYFEGTLNTNLSERLRLHLAGCEKCTAFAVVVRETLKTIEKEKSVSSDPDMYSGIISGLVRREHRVQLPYTAAFIFRRIAAVLILLSGLSAGIILGNSYLSREKLTADYRNEIYFLDGIHQETIENILLPE